jgi:hypothetical protein
MEKPIYTIKRPAGLAQMRDLEGKADFPYTTPLVSLEGIGKRNGWCFTGHPGILISLEFTGRIDSVTVGALPTDALAMISGMIVQWVLTQLMFDLLYVLVLWHFQSLILFFWLIILIEYSSAVCRGQGDEEWMGDGINRLRCV